MKVSRHKFEKRIDEAIASHSFLEVAKILYQHQKNRKKKQPGDCPVCQEVVGPNEQTASNSSKR